MLYAIGELSEHAVGNIAGALGNEIDSDTFGSNQAHYLFDFVNQCSGRVFEHQMRFIEKHDQLGLLRIANFWQILKQFGQQPQQQRGIHDRFLHQLVGHQHVDKPFAIFVDLHQVIQFEHRFTEKLFGTASLQYQVICAELHPPNSRRCCHKSP